MRPLHPRIPPDTVVLEWLARPRVKVTPRRLKKWRRRYAHEVLRCTDTTGFADHQWRPAPGLLKTHGPGAEVCAVCGCTFAPIPY